MTLSRKVLSSRGLLRGYPVDSPQSLVKEGVTRKVFGNNDLAGPIAGFAGWAGVLEPKDSRCICAQ